MSNKDNKNPIFGDRNYGISETVGITGVLSRLWRVILMNLGMKPESYEMSLLETSKRAKQYANSDRLSKTMGIANLRRELDSPTMTWKVFVKGLRIIRVVKVTLSVNLTFSTGVETTHSVDVDLGGHPNINEFTGI